MYEARTSHSAPRVSRREIEVLRLIVAGKTSQEIAEALFVSKRTVDFHLHNLYGKLQVSNRIQALCRAVQLGLISKESFSAPE